MLHMDFAGVKREGSPPGPRWLSPPASGPADLEAVPPVRDSQPCGSASQYVLSQPAPPPLLRCAGLSHHLLWRSTPASMDLVLRTGSCAVTIRASVLSYNFLMLAIYIICLNICF